MLTDVPSILKHYGSDNVDTHECDQMPENSEVEKYLDGKWCASSENKEWWVERHLLPGIKHCPFCGEKLDKE